MNPLRWRGTLSLLVVLAVAPNLWAQSRAPHLGYVYPAGGRQGDTFQIEISGQYLDGASNVYVSGSGVRATVIEHIKPLAGQVSNDLRLRMRELQKKGMDTAGLKEIAEIQGKLNANSNRTAYPGLSETVACQVTIAANAEPGARELRLQAAAGLSNPLVFCVGQLPEFREKDWKSSTADANLAVTLPAGINGRIVPGSFERYRSVMRRTQAYLPADVDRYRFAARKGQQLVLAVKARELTPYLADAVPGWFQATVALYDTQGKELAYDDDYRFHPDPVLHYEVPKDGDYVIEIKDAIYRGREDFVYRVMVGEFPFVTSIFPLGGRAGEQVSIELKGWNLPTNKLTMNTKGKKPGVYPVSVRARNLVSNQMPFAVDTLPECLEKEPNNEFKTAQKVTLPIIVNGRIDQPGDWDIFRFTARAGGQIVAEVNARRLDSPLDSVLRLTDARGRQLAFNDDHEDKGAGLYTHFADSLLTATMPADGTYYLHLGDIQQKGGVEYAYRLCLSPPRPDFDLRVVPSVINVAAGRTARATVYALRKDGFSSDITLALKDAPKGYVLKGNRVPADQDKAEVTLTVPPTPPAEPLSLTMEGRATVGGRQIVRQAVPADDMMQAFAYRHLVAAKDLKVAVIKRGGAPASAKALGSQPVKTPAGGASRSSAGMSISDRNHN
jgi:hypothetical protein